MGKIELINLAPDSSFENSSWDQSSYLQYFYPSISSQFDGKTVLRKITQTQLNLGRTTHSITISLNWDHKFYAAFHVTEELSTSQWVWTDPAGNSTFQTLSISNNTPIINSIQTHWYRYSGKISLFTNSLSKIGFQMNQTKASPLYIDGVMLIDLTEAFGEDNEPTKEWCDENIPYFEDSYTLAEASIVIKNHHGEWVKAKNVYQKISDGWSEITDKYAINDLFSKTKRLDVDYHEKKQSDTFLGHCRALIRPNDAGTTPVDVSKYNQTLTITTPSVSTFASPLSDGNKTFSFTSINNAIKISDISTLPNFSTSDWTIDWWEYRQDTTTEGASFCIGGPTKWTFLHRYLMDNNMETYISRDGSTWDLAARKVSSAYTKETWQHHAVVKHDSDILFFVDGKVTLTLNNIGDFNFYAPFIIDACWNNKSMIGNMDEFRISDFAVWTSDFTPKTTRYLNNGEEYDSLPRGDADDEFVLLGKKFKDDSLHGHEVTNVGCSIMAPTQIATASLPEGYKTIPAIDTQGKCVFELQAAALTSSYSTYKIEADIAICDSTSSKWRTTGIGYGLNDNVCMGINDGGYFIYGNGKSAVSTGTKADYGMHHHVLDLKNGKYQLDSNINISFTFNGGSNSKPFYAGGLINDQNNIIYHNEIIYRYTFYNGDNKVNDFFPVQRESDGVIGLFDIVKQKFIEPNVANVATVFPKNHDSVYYIDNQNYITLEPYDLAAHDFSIEWWEYPIVNTCGTRFASIFPDAYNNGSGGLLLGFVSTAPNALLYGSYGVANGSAWTIWSQKAMTANTLNIWTHRRYERISTVMYEYINGTKTNVYTCNNWSFWASSTFPMAIGRWAKNYTNAGSYFQGYMQNFRIHKGAIGNGTTAPTDDLTIPQLDITVVDKGEGNKLPIPKREYAFDGVFYESGDGSITNNSSYTAYGNGATIDIDNTINDNFSSSLSFDGENNGDGCSVEIPLNLSKDFTVEAWLNVWEVPAQMSALLSLQDSDSTNVVTLLHGLEYITLYVDSTASDRATATANEWHHYAIMKKGDRISWFYDGEFIDVIKQVSLTNTTSAILSINGNSFGNNFVAGGSGIYVNDLYITNKAIYDDNGFTPPEEYREPTIYDFVGGGH